MTKILFIHDINKLQPQSLAECSLGGIETVTLALAEAFADNSEVTIASFIDEKTKYNDINWISVNALQDAGKFDLIISNNNSNAFSWLGKANAKTQKAVWQHNPLSLEKSIRKKQFLSTIKHAPHLILVGQKQRAKISNFIPYKSRSVIPHGTLDLFREVTPKAKPKKRIIWVSQPQRGLLETLDLWINQIFPKAPDATFEIVGVDTQKFDLCLSPQALADNNIILHPRKNKQQLAEIYADSRLMIYPGSADETFCLAASESQTCGVPIITKGIGSLSERVKHRVNGIITQNEQEYTNSAIEILNNDKIWQKYRNNCTQNSHNPTWSEVKDIWLERFNLG